GVNDVAYQIGWNSTPWRLVPAVQKAVQCASRVPTRVKRLSTVDNGDGMAAPATGPPRHCVLAIGCGCSVGWAIETNSVARNNPIPSGVGIEKRNGTTTRVPTIGASQTSASRRVTRYLMAGRSGT